MLLAVLYAPYYTALHSFMLQTSLLITISLGRVLGSRMASPLEALLRSHPLEVYDPSLARI